MCSGTKDIAPIWKEIFPSPEMASYLAKCKLTKLKIRDAVAYAAIPLERKRDIFLQLASGKNTAYFRRQAASIEAAIREMQPRPGEFFVLKHFCYDEDKPFFREETLEPYLAWEHIRERIREYLGYLEDGEKELTWFEVEKWSPDGNGRLKNDYDYTIFGGEVCYFSHNIHSSRDWLEFSTNCDLNLPVPFHAGDLVTIDCRPSEPVSHAVILEVGDNRDCCCLQALYRNDDGTWSTGAVKHGQVFPICHSPSISPLYRLASFRGQLSEEERLLEQVSRYVNGEEERGADLWHFIYELCEDRRNRTVTEMEILSYITDEGAKTHDI